MLQQLRRPLTFANVTSVLALVFAMGGGAYAISAIPGPNGLIHGCYQKRSGTLRVIARGKHCRKSEKPLAWNQTGPQGLRGQQGLQGQQGPKGDTGPATGSAGGDLTGSYPNPTIAAHAVTPGKIGVIPQASATNSTNKNVTSGSSPAVTFDTNDFDTAGLHSTSTNTDRLTAPIAGVYEVNLEVRWSSNATGSRFIAIQKNNGGHLFASWEPANGTSDVDQSVSGLVKLAAGDYVNAVAFQDSGSTLAILNDPSPHFSMTWVGAG